MNKYPGSLVDIEYCLPEPVLSNKYFEEKFPEWKVDQTEKKTGVLERRIAHPDQTAYDLSVIAVQKILKNNIGLKEKVDAIVYCTQSPDYIMPSNAFLLQRDFNFPKLKIAYDYNLACSGYVYGLMMASSYIKMGLAKNILLVTADTYSKYLDENDRATRMLFGDGASVSWISDNDYIGDPIFKEFCAFDFNLDAGGWDKFIIKSGAHRNPRGENSENFHGGGKIFMNGIQVVNFVNHSVVKHITQMLEEKKLNVQDIDQFFFHQASKLAIESLAKKVKIPEDRIFFNIEKIGNTVSSSLPILIKDYKTIHLDRRDRQCLICGFGVGFSWGTLLAKR